MFSRLLFVLLITSAIAPAVLAQSPAATSATTASAQYGIADVIFLGGVGCKLNLQDGVTPNARRKHYKENGHDKLFADEAAVLNFLAAQGWEILPYDNNNSSRYFLKRRAQ